MACTPLFAPTYSLLVACTLLHMIHAYIYPYEFGTVLSMSFRGLIHLIQHIRYGGQTAVHSIAAEI